MAGWGPFLIVLQIFQELGTHVIDILQMRRRSLREAKQLVRGHSAANRRAGIQTRARHRATAAPLRLRALLVYLGKTLWIRLD